MTALANLLDQIRVRGATYFSKRLSDEWGIEVTRHENLCRFHFVLSGETWIVVPETGRRERLRRYDFAIVPHGRAHTLCDSPDSAITKEEAIPGDGPAQNGPIDVSDGVTGLLCGYFRYAELTSKLLTGQFPDLLILRADESGGRTVDGMRSMAKVALSEASADDPAAVLILNRCMEILFLYVLRDWARNAFASSGPLAALSDDRIGRAVAAIMDRPQEPWTVERLARLAGQSRTAFAGAFKAEFGLGPIEFLHRFRIELAQRILTESDLRLDAVAARVGYQDTSAFGRAFSRTVGVSPALFRKASQN